MKETENLFKVSGVLFLFGGDEIAFVSRRSSDSAGVLRVARLG